jgi:hypothetical protein
LEIPIQCNILTFNDQIEKLLIGLVFFHVF